MRLTNPSRPHPWASATAVQEPKPYAATSRTRRGRTPSIRELLPWRAGQPCSEERRQRRAHLRLAMTWRKTTPSAPRLGRRGNSWRREEPQPAPPFFRRTWALPLGARRAARCPSRPKRPEGAAWVGLSTPRAVPRRRSEPWPPLTWGAPPPPLQGGETARCWRPRWLARMVTHRCLACTVRGTTPRWIPARVARGGQPRGTGAVDRHQRAAPGEWRACKRHMCRFARIRGGTGNDARPLAAGLPRTGGCQTRTSQPAPLPSGSRGACGLPAARQQASTLVVRCGHQ